MTLNQILTIFCTIQLNTFTIAQNNTFPTNHIPKGYTIFDKLSADFNHDGLKDSLFIMKGTSKEAFLPNQFDKIVDRNRRGLLIFLNKGDKWELPLKNLDCFASENENGGVYFAPELSVEPSMHKINIKYWHGRYGFWEYTFRYADKDFELIRFYAAESTSGGSAFYRTTEIDFINGKKHINNNVSESPHAGNEVFETVIEEYKVGERFRLSEIEDFGELYFYD